MFTLIKQELFKLMHKKGTWLAVLFMVAVQVGFAIAGQQKPKLFSPTLLYTSDYIGGALVMFIMIASCASMIAMEFQYGTIKQLLYRQYYRSQVFISKLIVLVLQLVVLQAIASAVTHLLTVVLFPKYDLQATAAAGHTVLQQYWLGLAGTTLSSLMLLSVVVLLATLFKSNAAATAAGYVGYFVMSIASSILFLAINYVHWLKWNPFMMLMLASQMQDPKNMSKLSLLSTNAMIACTVGYTVLFSFIAYLSFRRRAV